MSFSNTITGQLAPDFKGAGRDGPDAADALAIRRIGLIGAKVRGDLESGDATLIEQDTTYLTDTIKVLRDFDFPVTKNPEFNVINRAYGQDYLAPAVTGTAAPHEQIDVAVACYLHNPKNPDKFRLGSSNAGNMWISPVHDRPGVWAKASAARGAKLVVVYGYNPETDLMPDAFHHYPYFNLIQFGGDENGHHTTGGVLIHSGYAKNLMEQGRMHHMLTPYVEHYMQTGRAAQLSHDR